MRPVGLLLLVAVLLLAGCGSAPERTDPTGTDGLTVPTPSPDPDDFVGRIDNRWLPLAPGREWTYDASGGRSRSRTVTVLDQEKQVAGVTTTVVRTTTDAANGRVLAETEAYYAQDRAGNVWVFGHTGPDAWLAGESGAQATLAMAAAPRHGDGYAVEFVRGEIVATAEVLRTDASASTPYGGFDGVVEIEERPRVEGKATVRSYAPGVGLVEQRALDGIDLELTALEE